MRIRGFRNIGKLLFFLAIVFSDLMSLKGQNPQTISPELQNALLLQHRGEKLFMEKKYSEALAVFKKSSPRIEKILGKKQNSVNTFRLTQQGAMDATMARLKHAAAALGANGILLNNVGNAPFATVTQGSAYGTANAAVYGNTAYANFSGNSMAMTSTLMMKTAGGMAIYVHEE